MVNLIASRIQRLFVFLLVALAVSFHSAAVSHGSSGAVEKKLRILTLQDLLEMALARSPEIEITKSEVKAAKSDLKQVKAAYFPRLEMIVVTGPAADAEEPEVRDGKIIDPSPTGILDIGIFGRLDFTLTQPLYTFGKLSNRKEAALEGIKAKQVEMKKKRADITLRVKQLYYAFVLARQGVSVADEASSYFKDARERVQLLLKEGSLDVDESDLYIIDAYRAEAKRFKADAQRGARVAYFALKSLIGMPPDEDFDVAEKSLPMNEKELESQERYIELALAKRPEMKTLEHGLMAKRYLVEAARSDLYPSFFATVFGSFAGAPGRDSFDSAYFTDELNHAYAGFVAGLKWDFDFGVGAAKVDKARAEYSKLLYTKAHAEQNIPIQVADAYQEVLGWKKAVEAYEEAASASRKWVVVAFANFDMGVGTAKAISDAIEKYGQNRGNYLEALYNYNLSLARLEYVIGAIDE